jgi:hypothetical protein
MSGSGAGPYDRSGFGAVQEQDAANGFGDPTTACDLCVAMLKAFLDTRTAIWQQGLDCKVGTLHVTLRCYLELVYRSLCRRFMLVTSRAVSPSSTVNVNPPVIRCTTQHCHGHPFQGVMLVAVQSLSSLPRSDA